jgi:crossover junction endodeoxyribonuclease RusA
MAGASFMVIELPWPPSVNHYWRRQGNRYFVSSEGKTYKDTVYYLCAQYRGLFKPSERLSLMIDAFPPDKRRRDLDNLIKSVQDSLQYAEVYEDDSQIDCLTIKRNVLRENKIIVTITEN